jgi:hypothetical protein
MDTNQLIKDAKARFKHNSAKAYLKDKYQSKLLFASQGGLWEATPELIGFVASSSEECLIILDRYENPVQVDRLELLEKLETTYNVVMNMWFAEWQELQSKR